jgi:hypothetical protein
MSHAPLFNPVDVRNRILDSSAKLVMEILRTNMGILWILHILKIYPRAHFNNTSFVLLERNMLAENIPG